MTLISITHAPSVLLLSTDEDRQNVIAVVNLGATTDSGLFDRGELSPSGGLLHLHVDGVPVGALFFDRSKTGDVSVTFGEVDPEEGFIPQSRVTQTKGVA